MCLLFFGIIKYNTSFKLKTRNPFNHALMLHAGYVLLYCIEMAKVNWRERGGTGVKGVTRRRRMRNK